MKKHIEVVAAVIKKDGKYNHEIEFLLEEIIPQEYILYKKSEQQ